MNTLKAFFQRCGVFFKKLWPLCQKTIKKLAAFWANKKSRARLIYWTLLGLFGCIFILSGVMISLHFYQAQNSATQFESLIELTEIEKPVTAAERYAPVLAQNDDFIGWIKIGGTVIDYPVVQSPDRPDYYLRRGFDKQYSYYGVPYANELCDIQNSDNIVIYGHNMKNGTMFSDLEKYTQKEFYDANKLVTFDTLAGFGTYEIIATFKTVAGAPGGFEYQNFIGGTEEQFNEYVATCKKLAFYDTGVTAVYGDKLLTLSTCEYSNENGRLVVVAKKIA